MSLKTSRRTSPQLLTHIAQRPLRTAARSASRSSVGLLKLVAGLALLSIGVVLWVMLRRPPSYPLIPETDIIAFVQTQGPDGSQIYLIGADGSHPTRLTYLPERLKWWPVWAELPLPGPYVVSSKLNSHPHPAPDHRGIVFFAYLNGNESLYKIGLDGSGLMQVPMPDRLLGNPNISLSPDGRHIAYVTRNQELAITTVDDVDERCLTCGRGISAVSGSAWSPDGSRVVFEGGGNLYVMTGDGLRLQQLTDTPNGFNVEAAWSPDGQRIVFRSLRDDQDGIYVMNADGTEQMRLTARGIQPAWSPDGRRIVFTEGGHIYVMNADGSGLTRFTTVPGGAMEPTWIHSPAMP